MAMRFSGGLKLGKSGSLLEMALMACMKLIQFLDSNLKFLHFRDIWLEALAQNPGYCCRDFSTSSKSRELIRVKSGGENISF